MTAGNCIQIHMSTINTTLFIATRLKSSNFKFNTLTLHHDDFLGFCMYNGGCISHSVGIEPYWDVVKWRVDLIVKWEWTVYKKVLNIFISMIWLNIFFIPVPNQYLRILIRCRFPLVYFYCLNPAICWPKKTAHTWCHENATPVNTDFCEARVFLKKTVSQPLWLMFEVIPVEGRDW